MPWQFFIIFGLQEEKVDITADGKDALIRLAQGDMRKVINILQSCAMAFPKVI